MSKREMDRLDWALLVFMAALAWEADSPTPLIWGAIIVAFLSPLMSWAGEKLGDRVHRRRRDSVGMSEPRWPDPGQRE